MAIGVVLSLLLSFSWVDVVPFVGIILGVEHRMFHVKHPVLGGDDGSAD